jgi:LysR family transcriptional regulator for metE and metH
VDVKQKVQFGGHGALLGFEIDLLVTPDPVFEPEIRFEAVFDYEQVLAVSQGHALAGAAGVEARQLRDEVLITYPVSTDRLDIYTQFLLPAGVTPKSQKTVENTDIMMQLVASGRGVAALPRWLIQEYRSQLSIVDVRLGQTGIFKQIFVGVREADTKIDYIAAFVELARVANRPCRD